MRLKVEVLRTIATSVEVDADSPEDAIEMVNKTTYPLPAIGEWDPLDSWEYVVYDPETEGELARD